MSFNLSIFKTLRKPYVLVLVAPPLCGKTTFCKEFLEKVDKDAVVINRDNIMLSLHINDDYDQAYNSVNPKEINKILREQLMDANKNLKNTLIDMTHMSQKRRVGNLSYFSKKYYKVAVVFPFLDDAEYKRRNEIRIQNENKSISDGTMRQMLDIYKPVDKSEGFDKIVHL